MGRVLQEISLFNPESDRSCSQELSVSAGLKILQARALMSLKHAHALAEKFSVRAANVDL